MCKAIHGKIKLTVISSGEINAKSPIDQKSQ